MSDAQTTLDLNADLAEGESPAHTAALMAHLTSANIACAGHAGTVESMRLALAHGHSLGLHLGAHPGMPGNFGRASADELTVEAFLELLHAQGGLFRELATAVGAPMHHVKLHGALYHATEHSESLRDAFVAWMAAQAPESIIYAQAGGLTVATARAAGLTAWDEAFADRGYLANGSLVPRSQPGALLTHPAAVANRVHQLAHGHPIPTIDGPPLLLPVHTICLHSDSPNSLALLQTARSALPLS